MNRLSLGFEIYGTIPSATTAYMPAACSFLAMTSVTEVTCTAAVEEITAKHLRLCVIHSVKDNSVVNY